MKRLTSILLAFVLFLSMASVAFAEEVKTLPDKIDNTTVWSYLDDNSDPAGNPSEEGYNRTAWTALDFDDSAWKTGMGGFGAKTGGSYSGASVTLAGCPGDETNFPTYYFRTKVNVEKASAVTAIKGSISYDDAAIVYINGVKAIAFNEAGCDTNSSYSDNKANSTESFEIIEPVVLDALKNGDNVVSVELHNHYDKSSDIWFAMNELSFSTDTLLLDKSAVWKYLDDNTDPAGDSLASGYNRTDWTAESFDIEGWKEAVGSFGSKRGGAVYDATHTADTVLEGCDGSNDTPAYFFRTTFNISNLERYTKLIGSLEYDDGVIVYINGQRIAAGYDNACDENGNSLGHGFDANLQYGGSNQGPDTLEIALFDLSILHNGENTIAVELHNGRKTSSDVWFSFGGLFLSTEEVIYQNNVSLSVGADESQMNFTWYSPLDNALVTVSENSDMTNGHTFAAISSVANDGQYSCKSTVTDLKNNTTYYYQLSNNENKGEIHSFTTGESGDFSFALVGDPQIGAGNTLSDTAGWENTLNTLATKEEFSDISFLVSAGDQVNSASDEAQYDGYLEHNALLGLPVATAIGNHDSSSNSYSQHFNVANESAEYGVTAAGGDYYFVYNNVLFFVLNSNAQSQEAIEGHKEFMQNAIEATKDKNISWKVAVFHHTLFTVASHAHDDYIENANGFKNMIIPVLEELDIDAVLMGHDHVYCRTYIMDGIDPITEFDGYEYGNGIDSAPTAVNDPDGILYITANSGSGSKNYGILNESFPFSAVQNQENSSNVSKITVTDNSFNVTTYRVADMSVVDSFTIKRSEDESQNTNLLIDQVYGGGGKGETPISNSFIELYNPTDEEINLSDYTLQYGDTAIDLNGAVPAKGSFLIIGAAEITTDEFLTYDLPEADQTCDLTINNKSYTIKLMKGETEIDSVTAGDSAETKISKQKSLKRNNHGDFALVVWEKASVTVDEAYVMANAPRNSKGEYGSVYTASSEPEYTPVVTGDTRVNGYYNSDSSIRLELSGRYNSGAMNADGGSLEIVSYNPVNGFAYAVSGVKGKLIAVNLNGNRNGDKVENLPGTEYDVKSLVNGFSYGDMTSVAVSQDGSKLAVAIQAENYADKGIAALFSCESDGSLTLISTVEVGVQPDMITFADNNTILTADEGEPREGVNGTDPKGSVTVAKIGNDNSLTANSVYFDSFDEKRDELTAAGVLIQKDTQPSTDFEPEYIAVLGNTAYVSLQEANAVAVLDIASNTFKGVYPLGFQDYGSVKLDLQKNDAIELENYKNVYGIKMPDGISVTSIGGKTYLLTANEGDSRADWAGLDNEYENVTSPTGDVTLNKKVVWFNANMWDGLDSNKAYIFGGRSFSIYEATDNGLKLVYDSGSGFEEVTAEKLPEYFNTSNDKITLDNRSGKKGPEPESVVTGTVGDKTYAFIALERIGGIMVYDITDPANAKFENYINSREFDDVIKGDVSPEGLCFIPASDSKTGKAVLLAACEVSGTLAAYDCDYIKGDIPQTNTDNKQPTTVTTPPTQNVTKPTATTNNTVNKVLLKAPKVKAKSVKGKIKITLKKQKGTAGYQVRYRIKGKWKVKTFKIKKNTIKLIKNLKKGKYKVQIRLIDKTKKSLSNWSKTKIVKVK
ncbi:MAG: choice-of-anchor I family protein [Acutalibacteraceae bacterium]